MNKPQSSKIKRYMIDFALVFLFLIILTACQKVERKSEMKPEKSLSDMQITSCNAAHGAGTCDTRLQELGIVMKEDCCEVLGKCC